MTVVVTVIFNFSALKDQVVREYCQSNNLYIGSFHFLDQSFTETED